MQYGDKVYKRKPHFKIKDGDKIGPKDILLIERTYLDEKNHWHGNFLCPYCDTPFDAIINYVSSGATISCGCVEHENRAKSKIKPMIGKKFDKLTVVQQLPEYTKCVRYLCQCDCGNYIICNGDNLRNGDRTSCGCKKREPKKDLTGQKFGKLTVLELSSERSSWGEIQWKCQCECGNIVKISTSNLTTGNSLSCGCNKSKGEEKLRSILSSLDMEYISQCSFEDCINPKTGYVLRFDFYLPKYNLCIEFDGEQHYHPIKHFGGEEYYEDTVFRDTIKNNYCSVNGISLLRIPYTSYDELCSDFLLLKIKEIEVI